jgi:hypothetical protein
MLLLAAFVASMANAFGNNFKQWMEVLEMLAPFLLAGTLTLLSQFTLSRAGLLHWAETNRYEVLEQELAFFPPSRFSFRWIGSGKRCLYRVKIRDERGEIRTGFVLPGLFKVEVQWDFNTVP